jgi:hypothetical protein
MLHDLPAVYAVTKKQSDANFVSSTAEQLVAPPRLRRPRFASTSGQIILRLRSFQNDYRGHITQFVHTSTTYSF